MPSCSEMSEELWQALVRAFGEWIIPHKKEIDKGLLELIASVLRKKLDS